MQNCLFSCLFILLPVRTSFIHFIQSKKTSFINGNSVHLIGRNPEPILKSDPFSVAFTLSTTVKTSQCRSKLLKSYSFLNVGHLLVSTVYFGIFSWTFFFPQKLSCWSINPAFLKIQFGFFLHDVIWWQDNLFSFFDSRFFPA